MIGLTDVLSEVKICKDFEKFEQIVRNCESRVVVNNASCASTALAVSLLFQKTDQNIVVVVSNEIVANKMADDLSLLLSFDNLILLKSREMIYGKIEISSREYEHQRLKVFCELLGFETQENKTQDSKELPENKINNKKINNKNKFQKKILITTAEALHQPVMAPDEFRELVFKLEISQTVKISELSQKLLDLGFVKNHQVDGVGQFSVRGEVVDIFSPNLDYPVRLDFWDDEIDNIFFFDLETQRKIDKRLENVFIVPAREILIHDKVNSQNKIRIINKLTCLENLVADSRVKKSIKLDIEKIKNNILIDNLDKYINLISEEKNFVLDYLKNSDSKEVEAPIVVLFDYEKIVSVSQSLWWHYLNDLEILNKDKILDQVLTDKFGYHIFSWEEILEKIKDGAVIQTNIFDGNAKNFTNFEVKNFDFYQDDLKENHKYKNYNNQNISQDVVVVDSNQRELSPWNGDIVLLESDLKYYQDKNFKIIVLVGSETFRDNLLKNLREKNFLVSKNFDDLTSGFIIISDGALSSGVEYFQDKVIIITVNKNKNINTDLGGRKKRTGRKKNSKDMMINSLEDISVGDYVVHVSHGIGIFDGINKLQLDGVIQDYIKIKYQNSDVLYVPVTQLDLVSKYIGNQAQDDKVIKLSKLGSLDWQKRKNNVKKAVQDIAKDLLKLQSQRLSVKGFAFGPDTDWQKQFEDLFEHQETDAQLRCIQEIKEDMESPVPMDRLLCGDVGVGKTEVALRMAFKAVMDSKQVAILAPTTVLSLQHYNTIVSRLSNFPIKVELLSRLKTVTQQKDILKKLETGEIEIVVGTHRLLQKDVKFKDLGLIIIDEEQRFGVADKEKFKKLKCNVDVLYLSATPIPRTLNMAMSGLKDMSVIDETPQDRMPIQTYVLEYDENIIASAIFKEMRRGGMVFYLHNRVETIDFVAQKILSLVPEARVAVAHGKMSQNQLEPIWQRLLNHEIDVLVCTTIIETGIDIPFCNTLIVEDSDRMGLSQLHQLRGRIGRSSKRAFAYMTYKKGKSLSDVSVKRLNAIREFTRFGSGFKIALRDLEIRGAGNILGAQQHGHIDSVGYDMYFKLLSDAVSKEKGQEPEFLTSEKCSIDIKITAYLPESYISNLSVRIDIYKKIALIKTKEDYDDLLDELVDRFGEPPPEVISLLGVSLSRNLAIKNNIREIVQKSDGIYIYQEPFNSETAGKICEKYSAAASVVFEEKTLIKIDINKNPDKNTDQNSLIFLTEILSII